MSDKTKLIQDFNQLIRNSTFLERNITQYYKYQFKKKKKPTSRRSGKKTKTKTQLQELLSVIVNYIRNKAA